MAPLTLAVYPDGVWDRAKGERIIVSYVKRTRNQHFKDEGPKRILALDGGGLKGIVTLGFLGRLEETLRERHGSDPEFRLCHYFDLIAGTSTGAIIAAALALGLSVDEVTGHYMTMGEKVFEGSWFRKGVLRARYDDEALKRLLKDVLGKDTLLGSQDLRTGLLVVTKRMDTGSTWPLGNNPRGRYFRGHEGSGRIGNGDYPLWQVVRASTAAPHFFDPETIAINVGTSRKQAVRGDFVDGGVSPHNNPALQALMYATLDGHRVGWPMGADRLLLVSVGTGRAAPGHEPSRMAAAHAMKSLLSLMADCGDLVETMLQWMSSGARVRWMDRELEALQDDLLAPEPLLSYLRYDVSFDPEAIDGLRAGLSEGTSSALDAKRIDSLSKMDRKDNLTIWKEIGAAAAADQVDPEELPERFDLPASRG